MRVEVLCVPRVVPLTLSCRSRRLCSSSGARSLSSWLVAVVDDEGGLVYVEVGRRRRIVQIVVCVQGGGVLGVVRVIYLLVALTECLGRALEGLLDLLLARLIQEGLELLV